MELERVGRRLRAFVLTNGFLVSLAKAGQAMKDAAGTSLGERLASRAAFAALLIAACVVLVTVSGKGRAPVGGEGARRRAPTWADWPELGLRMALVAGFEGCTLLAAEAIAVAPRGGLATATPPPAARFGDWSPPAWTDEAAFFARFVVLSFLFEVLFDLFHYWAHRICHEVPRLYRLHKVHHKYLHPSPVSTYQMDPFDVLLSNVGPSLAALALLDVLLGLRFAPRELSMLWAYKIFVEVAGHAGFSTTATSFPQCAPLPQLLGIELRTFDHDLHHSRPAQPCNFSKRFTLWDRVFGTYRECPELAALKRDAAKLPGS